MTQRVTVESPCEHGRFGYCGYWMTNGAICDEGSRRVLIPGEFVEVEIEDVGGFFDVATTGKFGAGTFLLIPIDTDVLAVLEAGQG